jgi:acyl-coenzyme A synthetase/AMP-(fatty) acid ligase
VDPLLVGQVLQRHPLVAAAQAYGRHSAVLGQVIVADVIADPAMAPGTRLVPELKRFAAARLSPYECPRRIRVVDRLRLAASGKLLVNG